MIETVAGVVALFAVLAIMAYLFLLERQAYKAHILKEKKQIELYEKLLEKLSDQMGSED